MRELSNDKVMRELSKEEMKAVSGGAGGGYGNGVGGNAYGKNGLAPADGVRDQNDGDKGGVGPGMGNNVPIGP